MKKFYILFFLLYAITSRGQQFYITSYDYSTFLNTIKYVDANLNVTPLATLYFNGDQIFDIAFAPNGKLYGTTSNALIEINLQTGTSTEVYNFPATGKYNSLVCNSENQVIALEYYSQRLITIDLVTFTELSNIYLGESSPGDLTFYKGNLLFQSATSNNMMAYDGNSLETVGCGLNAISGDPILFWGLSNYTDACETNIVYGFDPYGAVFRYNFEANTSEEIGQLNESYSWPINGATSINEYLASACPLENMNAVNCNLVVDDQNMSTLMFYPNPVMDILHIGNLDNQDQFYISIYSVEGKIVYDAILISEVDVSNLNSGIYFLKIFDKSKMTSITKKIVKN